MDDRNARTVYCGNLYEKVTEELLHELFLQAGPLECVKIPKGRNYGFITFKHDVSVPYAVALMHGLSLFGKEIRLELRTGSAPEHNRYLDMMAAHKQSLNNPRKSHASEYPCPGNYPVPDSYRGSSIYPNSRDDTGHSLKDRYINSPLANRSVTDIERYNGFYPETTYLSMHSSPLGYDTRAQLQFLQDDTMRTLFPSPLQHGYSPYLLKDSKTSLPNYQQRERSSSRRYH